MTRIIADCAAATTGHAKLTALADGYVELYAEDDDIIRIVTRAAASAPPAADFLGIADQRHHEALAVIVQGIEDVGDLADGLSVDDAAHHLLPFRHAEFVLAVETFGWGVDRTRRWILERVEAAVLEGLTSTGPADGVHSAVTRSPRRLPSVGGTSRGRRAVFRPSRPHPASGGATQGEPMSGTPTVVLVHGAFADASSFARVVPELLDADTQVWPPPDRTAAWPVTPPTSPPSCVRSTAPSCWSGTPTAARSSPWPASRTTSWDWSTSPATPWTRARASVGCRDASPTPPLAEALVYTPFPVAGSDEPGMDVSVDVARFPRSSRPDVDPELTRVLAVSQRPLAAAAFGEEASAAAWKTKPAWGVVASADQPSTPTSSGSATSARR